MKDWNSSKWRTFWCWLYIRQIARITKDWEKIIYKFQGEFQRGQPAINTSNAVSSALYMSLPFIILQNIINYYLLLFIIYICMVDSTSNMS